MPWEHFSLQASHWSLVASLRAAGCPFGFAPLLARLVLLCFAAAIELPPEILCIARPLGKVILVYLAAEFERLGAWNPLLIESRGKLLPPGDTVGAIPTIR